MMAAIDSNDFYNTVRETLLGVNIHTNFYKTYLTLKTKSHFVDCLAVFHRAYKVRILTKDMRNLNAQNIKKFIISISFEIYTIMRLYDHFETYNNSKHNSGESTSNKSFPSFFGRQLN